MTYIQKTSLLEGACTFFPSVVKYANASKNALWVAHYKQNKLQCYLRYAGEFSNILKGTSSDDFFKLKEEL